MILTVIDTVSEDDDEPSEWRTTTRRSFADVVARNGAFDFESKFRVWSV